MFKIIIHETFCGFSFFIVIILKINKINVKNDKVLIRIKLFTIAVITDLKMSIFFLESKR